MTMIDLEGYTLGLESIRQELNNTLRSDGGSHGVSWEKDIHYWKDAIKWLSSTAALIPTRSFIAEALFIMQQVNEHFSNERVRLIVVRAACSMKMVNDDVECLEKLLKLVSQTIRLDDRDEIVFRAFLDNVMQTIFSSGEISATRAELVPYLLRICSSCHLDESLQTLASLILDCNEDVPGKILWTLANVVSERIQSLDGDGDGYDTWIETSYSLGLTLLRTSNIKAKWHIARACRHIIGLGDCPIALRSFLAVQFETCREWVLRAEAPVELEDDLFIRYKEGLLAELSKTGE